ncbi:putative type VI secretion system effector [Enterobacter oligotrophicus]|uniref:putative type VI secretion system effector n=1 Tax=Enterobacter oligotrophicus TaxID=2478464 RepID=UPI0012612F64|nr:putative type VI secretion system effector [Enterobacter oligotrophicus]
MPNEALKFSDAPRPSRAVLKEKYPADNFLKIRSELAALQEKIADIESTRGRRDQLPLLRKQAQKLEEQLEDAPPDPVLPPPAPLIKVTGVLEEFSWRRVLHYFDPQAYPQTHEYFARQKERVARAAVVMTVSDSAATAQGMLLDGDRLMTCSWHITGRINGKRFSGWLGRCFCKVGEEVELIAAPVGDEYLVYALVKPQERSVSMTPGCYRGKRQARWGGTRFWMGMHGVGLLAVIIGWVVRYGMEELFPPELGELLLPCATTGGAIIICPALYSVWRRHPFPEEDLAEEIFTVMGLKNVTDINLSRLNRKRKRQWKRTGKPENPFRDQTPFLYTGLGREFYFY